MDIDRKQKDKILDWLCKRCGVLDFFFDEDNRLNFHFIGYNNSVVENVALTENEYENIKRKSLDDHILDLLLDVSRKGYTVSNCVTMSPSCYIKIIDPFCSLEQLQIEYDLCH